MYRIIIVPPRLSVAIRFSINATPYVICYHDDTRTCVVCISIPVRSPDQDVARSSVKRVEQWTDTRASIPIPTSR